MSKQKVTIKQLFDELANSNAVIKQRKTLISQRIKKLRLDNGYTHEQVANGTNIKPLTYSGYENAHNNTPIEALVRLAIFYDVSLDYLCGRTANKKGCYTTEENNEGAQQKKEMEEMIAKIVEDKLREQNKK